MNKDSFYRRAVEHLVSWCDTNFLELNVSKTKEIVFDFSTGGREHAPIFIKGEPVEMVQNFMYLGTILNNKLDWAPNVDLRYSKANKRLSCLRRLKKFRIDRKVLEIFFKTTIESTMLFNQLCYYANADSKDTDRLEMISRRAEKITGRPITMPGDIYNRAALRKLRRILKDEEHPLHVEAKNREPTRGCSNVMRSFTSRTNRFKDSFLPTSVRLFNAQAGRKS